MKNNNETLEEKMDYVVRLLAMNLIKDLKTDKEKVHFLHNTVGLDSSKVAEIMNKSTKELSTYLYEKKPLKKSKQPKKNGS